MSIPSAGPIHLLSDMRKLAEVDDICQEGGNHRMAVVIGWGSLELVADWFDGYKAPAYEIVPLS